MFGKKAKEIKSLTADLRQAKQNREQAQDAYNLAECARRQLEEEVLSLRAAVTDKDTKLANAQALIQRVEADIDAQKRRADENYTQRCDQEKRADDWYDKYLAEKTRADSLVVPFTAAVQAEAEAVGTVPVDIEEVKEFAAANPKSRCATVAQGTYLPERAFPPKPAAGQKPKAKKG